jgi:D-beta-D-heptose 7-phosphate kinase/D-beta-D-heptose 1-phosphate adenosyltransferase
MQVLDEHKIHYANSNLLETYGGHIPVKRRFWDGKVQVHRWDIESPLYGMDKKWLVGLETSLVRELEDLPTPDVIVFSDYDKGLFGDPQYWMENAKKLGAPIIVDPKRGPASQWKGCTIFKPNAKEARDISGLRDWRDQCEYFVKHTECDHVVITHGGEGVKGWSKKMLSTQSNFWEYKPERSVNVESVIGAGDAFVAMLAMAVGHRLHAFHASELAYRAGEVYVQNSRNRPIVPAELNTSKFVNPSDLAKRDFKLVFTNGCFDCLHQGHIKLLEEAKKKGDKLLVALNSDASVQRLKGESRPINCLMDWMELISRLDMVDYVTWFDEDTPIEVIKQCRPNSLIKGGDYSLDQIVGADLVPQVEIIPFLPGYSTTNTINKINGSTCS